MLSSQLFIDTVYGFYLTLWELAYNIFVLWFRSKKQQFLVALPPP